MRIYLTGGSGFLGSNIIRLCRERYDDAIFTTLNRWRPDGPVDFEHGPVDLTDAAAVLASVEAYQPDVIIHSAILNNLPLMYADRELGWRLYVETTRNLVDAANATDCSIILISTDWVFDGTQSGADESTPPNPVNYYGVLKVACERVVMERAKKGAVARVAGVNGVHWMMPDDPQGQNAGYGHFSTTVIHELKTQGKCGVWIGDNINMRATPSLASESAEMIRRIAERDLQGIFHCTGGEAIGRVELAMSAAEVFGYDPHLVQPVAPPHMPELAGIRIPVDTSVDARATAKALDYELPDVRQLLTIYRHQVETGQL